MSEQPPQPLLSATDLRCVRDRRVLFTGLEVTVDPGFILHIEGVNGAGKTSLLRVLCGLLMPQRGSIAWQGVDLAECRPTYFSNVLYLGHSLGLKLDLTALENLQFLHSLTSDPTEWNQQSAFTALKMLGLVGFEDIPVRSLSAGQRRRVALARLWIGRQPLWLLDEPLTALDRAASDNLEAHLSHHAAAGGAVVLTSHQPIAVANRRLKLS